MGSDVLGVAQYGDWKAATAALSETLGRRGGQQNGAGYFLAMAHWRLGEEDKARERYREALAWNDKCRPKDLELRRFRAEATQLLGVNEQLMLAEICVSNIQFVAAARHCAAAFAAEPRLGEDLSKGYHYAAAWAAARAACGQGEGAAQLDDNERARLRQQVLDWLRADLAHVVKRLDDPSPSAPKVRDLMEQRQGDPAFACVRDKDALAKLPEAERKAWQKFWADVAAALKRAKATGTRY
jgi:hypothetical protein